MSDNQAKPVRPENVFGWDDGDDVTEEPRFLRIYWEDHGDEYPWCIDGIDLAGRYTENTARFTTLAEVIDAVPEWVKTYSIEPERDWVPMTLRQVKAYLLGHLSSELTKGHDYTEVRETEHGVEYR